MFTSSRSRNRMPVQVSSEQMVTYSGLPGQDSPVFPLIVQPALPELDLATWLEARREEMRAQLVRHGAVLFRGFAVASAAAFRRVASALSGPLEAYAERAAPRREVDTHVYTSTEFSPAHAIPMHHEMSYARRWPLDIWFYCDRPALRGGSTPIAADRAVLPRIRASLRNHFVRGGLLYVRNFGAGVDLPWQEAFQTTSRAAVEDYCRATGIEVEWRDGDRLRTRQRGQVLFRHPATGETVWFNHAHVFHVSSLPRVDRDALLREFDDDELPRNVFHADGTLIADEMLDEIRHVYDRSAERFSWQTGDILLLDNVLASHGRDPFEGDRRTLVAMARMYDAHDAPAESTAP